MRKRTKWLAFALSVLFLLQSGIGSIFAVSPEAAEDTSAPVSAPCACGNDAESLVDHDDACEAKFFAMTEAVDKSAEELFAAWNSYDVKVQNYILTYLGEHDPNRLEALEELFAGTSSESENTQVVVNELGATIAGNLPTDLSISSSNLSEEEYPAALKETLASGSSGTPSGVIDITLYDGDGNEWQPGDDNPVTVSVDAAQYGFKDGDEFFIVHYHENGEPETMGPFTVENGKATFHTVRFSAFAFYVGGHDGTYLYLDPTNGYGAYRTYYVHPNCTVNLLLPAGATAMYLDRKVNTTGHDPYDSKVNGWWGSNFSAGNTGTYAYGSKLVYHAKTRNAQGVESATIYITIYFLGDPLNPGDASYGDYRVIYHTAGTGGLTFPGGNYFTTSSQSNTGMDSFDDLYADAGTIMANSVAGGYWYGTIRNSNGNTVTYLLITVSGPGSIPQYSLQNDAWSKINIRCLMYPNQGFPSTTAANPEAGHDFVTISHSFTVAHISDSLASKMSRGSWSAIYGNYAGVSTDSNQHFANYALCYDNFIYQSATGDIRGYTPDIDYNSFLASIASSGARDYNGAAISAGTIGNFSLIPYAVRCTIDGVDSGWYIDCYLAPKRTLSYNVNAPGTPSPSISTPSSFPSVGEYGASWESATVSDAPALNAQYTMTNNGTAYRFLGWSETQGGAVAYNPGDSYGAVDRNVTLYGVWQQVTLTITYDLRLPATPSPAITTPTAYTAGTVNGQISTTAPTPAGLNSPHAMSDGNSYHFMGWSTTAGGGVSYAPGATINTSSGITLYGVWERAILNFNLTFRVSGVNLTLDPDQSFVFRLQGSANDGTDIDVPFVVCGNNTVIFAELPVGNYAISVSDWAWRYGEWQWNGGAATEERSYTMGALNTDTEFTFTAIRTDSLWLDDNAYVKAP